MKKILASVLSLIMLFTAFSLFTPEASAAEDSTVSATDLAGEPARSQRIIFIGDSRCVDMQRFYAEEQDIYIAESGKSWYWFLGGAVPKLRKILVNDPDFAVVVMMGVNDCVNYTEGALESYSSYVGLFSELKSEFPETAFFFCSVNPVDEKYRRDKVIRNLVVHHDKDSFNAVIDTFNTEIRKTCTETEYLDCSGALGTDSFITTDGIHYTEETYRLIYAYCVNEATCRLQTGNSSLSAISG